MNTVFPSTAIPERIIQNHIFFKFTDLKLIIKLHIPSRKFRKRKQQPRQHIDTSWEARGTHALVFQKLDTASGYPAD